MISKNFVNMSADTTSSTFGSMESNPESNVNNMLKIPSVIILIPPMRVDLCRSDITCTIARYDARKGFKQVP